MYMLCSSNMWKWVKSICIWWMLFRARAHTHTHTHTHIHTRTHTLACIHARTFARTRSRAEAYTWAHAHTHTHTYTQTRAHTHTHTHIHTDILTQTHTSLWLKEEVYWTMKNKNKKQYMWWSRKDTIYQRKELITIGKKPQTWRKAITWLWFRAVLLDDICYRFSTISPYTSSKKTPAV